jgi:hypothetical protein
MRGRSGLARVATQAAAVPAMPMPGSELPPDQVADKYHARASQDTNQAGYERL